MRVCPVCNTRIIARSNKIYCSAKCRNKYHATKRHISDCESYVRYCVTCNATLAGRGRTKYCSVKCGEKGAKHKRTFRQLTARLNIEYPDLDIYEVRKMALGVMT